MMTSAERARAWRELREFKFYDAFTAYHWFNTPQELLDNRKPIDCAYYEVMTAIEELPRSPG